MQDIVDYNEIRMPGVSGKAKGTIEDFVVTIFTSKKRFTFRTKDGQIVDYRVYSDNGESEGSYEVR